MSDSGLLVNRDIEYDELEFDRNDMLTGEPRYIEDEIRNSRLAMILGGVAGVLCLVAMILTWILYFRERTRTFLWHAIWLIFAFLFGFGLAAWGATSESSVKVGKQPSANFTLAIFLGCLVFFVYLVAESLWLIFYKPIHYGYLVGLRGDNDLWNKRMISGSSFQDGWTADRRMMWWVTAFTLVSGICFAFGAYATRSVVWNRFQLTRIGLFAALISVVLAGFLVIYWAEECFEYESGAFYNFDKDVTRVLKVLAIVAIVFAALNAIVNFFKVKLGYFVLGLVSVILVICLITTTGVLWRNVRVNQNQARTGNCVQNLASIHEDNLKNICITGGKYLPAGSSCTKEFYVNRWENGSTAELRVLNPSCCQVGVSFYYLPYMQLAFWSVILILSLGIAIFFNFYLSDTSDYLSNAARPLNIIDFIGIGLIIALLLGWVLYYIFRKANKLAAPGYGFNASYNDPDKNPISNFQVVPRSVLANATPKPNSNACFNYDTKTMAVPAFSATDAGCTANCVHRVAILASGSKLSANNGNDFAILGDQNNRAAFFPGCTSKNSGYIFFYGTIDQVKKSLETVSICLQQLGRNPDVFFYHDQVPSGTLGGSGLKSSESGSTVLTDADSSTCAASFDSTNSACSGACKKKFVLPSTYTAFTLKGRLFQLKDGVEDGPLPGNLLIETSANGSPVGAAKKILAEGNNTLFTVADIPVYKDTDYILKVAISDPTNGVYLPKEVEILVPANNAGSDELSAGKIRLLTADGKICGVSDNACKTAQKRLNGIIKVGATDATDEAKKTALAGVQFDILKGFVISGTPSATVFSDSNGQATSSTLAYDSYTIIGTKAGYLPVSTRVDLQQESVDAQLFTLRPANQDIDYKVFATMDDPSVDLDLRMNMRNPNGVSCQLSPYNKYCPYSTYLNDVAFGSGQEAIGIKRLAVAEYVSFVTPASPYSNSCPAAESYKSTSAHYNQLADWSWEKVKALKPFESLGISAGTTAGTFGSKILAAVAKIIPGLDSIAPKIPVETDAQALIPKILMGLNGKSLSAAQQIKIPTNVKINAEKQNASPTDLNKNGDYVEKSKTSIIEDGIVINTVEFTDKDKEGNILSGKKVTKIGTSISNKTHVEGSENFVKTKNQKGEDLGDRNEIEIKYQFSNGSTQDLTDKSVSTVAPTGTTVKRVISSKLKGSNGELEEKSSDETKVVGVFPPATKIVSSSQSTQVKGTATTKKTAQEESNELSGQISKSSTANSQKSDSATGDSEEETVTTTTTGNGESTKTITKKTSKGVTTVTEKSVDTNKNGKASSKIEFEKVVETQGTKPSTIQQTTISTSTSEQGTVVEAKTTTKVTPQADGTSVTETTTTTTTKQADGSKVEDVSNFKKVSKADQTWNSERVVATKTFGKDGKQTEQIDRTLVTNKAAQSSKKSGVETTTVYGPNGPISKTEIQALVTPIDAKTEKVQLTTIAYTIDDKGVATVVSTNTSSQEIPLVQLGADPADGTTSYFGVKDIPKSAKIDALANPQVQPEPRSRLLAMKYAHLNTPSGTNVLLLNCFNGFGPASLVTLNAFLPTEPSFDQCIPKIAAIKPNFTIGKLQDAIKAASS